MYADKHCTLGREEVQENTERILGLLFSCAALKHTFYLIKV